MTEQARQDARDIVMQIIASSAAIQELGPVLDAAGPGFTRLRLTVRPSMLNGQKICYGGTIFALGDTAAALAAQTNGRAVTEAGTIDFIDAAREGDVLVAEARQSIDRGRTRMIDVRIATAEEDRTIAILRTRFRSLPSATA